MTLSANDIIRQFNALDGKPATREDLEQLLTAAAKVPGTERVQLRLIPAIGKFPIGESVIEIDPREPITDSPTLAGAPQKDLGKIRVKPIVKPSEKPVRKEKPVARKRVKPAAAPKAGLYGITQATQAVPTAVERETLPGEIGAFLGALQRYKLAIVISGETHSSKSEIGKQIADAFISTGLEVLWVDWEQGGLESDDTWKSIERNVSPENREHLHVSGDIPRDLDTLLQLANQYPVIVLDSGTKVKVHGNEWIDMLREKRPHTVWIPLMQQTSDGKTKGGSSAEYDAPVVVKTYRADESDYRRNYAYLAKSRGNKTGKYYNIAAKKLIPSEA